MAYAPAPLDPPIMGMASLFFKYRMARIGPDGKFAKFSIGQLSQMWEIARRYSSLNDLKYHHPTPVSLSEWGLGIRWLEYYQCGSVKGVVTEFQDVYENIAPTLIRKDLLAFRESFLTTAGRATALMYFQHPYSKLGQYIETLNFPRCAQITEANRLEDIETSIHNVCAQRYQWYPYSPMYARIKASRLERNPAPARNFTPERLNTDCWFEILKLLDVKDRGNMKLTCAHMYNSINESTLLCDLTRSRVFVSSLYIVGNQRNFQRIPMTQDTMDAQPFWHLEIQGARNISTYLWIAYPGNALVNAMASLSHPRRVVRISIDSVADAALMIFVWTEFLQEFCNLRFLNIVKCSGSLPMEAFETHKALNGLQYEVDVIEEATMPQRRRLLWVY